MRGFSSQSDWKKGARQSAFFICIPATMSVSKSREINNLVAIYRLVNSPGLGYTFLRRRFAVWLPPNRHVRQENWLCMRLSARSWKATDLDKNESSPRPAVRDGMEQEPFGFRVRTWGPGESPTSSGCAQRERDHRVRRRPRPGRVRTDRRSVKSASTPSLLHMNGF